MKTMARRISKLRSDLPRGEMSKDTPCMTGSAPCSNDGVGASPQRAASLKRIRCWKTSMKLAIGLGALPKGCGAGSSTALGRDWIDELSYASRMDLLKMLADLRQERAQIEEAIMALERLAIGRGKRPGRPPAWMTAASAPKRRGRPLGSKNKPKGAAAQGSI